jgi:ATP-dependent helicase HrpB
VFTLSQLPIEKVMPRLLEALSHSRQVILKAATGAGKSTHFPLTLVKQGCVQGKIVMLEPRRLAARSIAYYLAKCLGESVGETVGYRIRGDVKTSSSTQLEIVTEGVLTRMLQDDPELTGIDLVIFDEFHERSLHADTALAFTLEVQEALRDDLTVVIMSATLERETLEPIMPDAAYIESQGRSYPVDIRYSPLRHNEPLAAAMSRIICHLMANEKGSLLAFLPGVSAIKRVQQSLALSEGFEVCPLYGQLDLHQQQKAIQPAAPGQRKVVLATNIAETSLTIEGIRMVVDSGLEKTSSFDLKTGIVKLEQSRIAQSSSVQRTGRAGRLEEGVCVRLYSESQFEQQPLSSTPEILRSDLASLVLELRRWGCSDETSMKWLDHPKKANIEQANELLHALALIGDNGQLTRIGERAYGLGLEPRLASMVLQSLSKGSEFAHAAIALSCLLEEKERVGNDISISLHRWQMGSHSKTHTMNRRATMLARRVQCQFDVQKVQESLLGFVAALAYPDRIAQLRCGSGGAFLLANGHGAMIEDALALAENDYLVALDLLNSGRGNSQIHLAVAVDVSQLKQHASALFRSEEILDWDDAKGRVICAQKTYLGRLEVENIERPIPSSVNVAQALAGYVRRKGLTVLNWQAKDLELLERIRCAGDWLPELDWPDFSDASLHNELDLWLEPFLIGVNSAKALRKLNLQPALEARLGWKRQQKLNELLPTYLVVASGANKKIRYQSGHPPMLSVKLQEMFGEKCSPTIANNTQAVVLELLSPAQRPLQITRDLAAFWQGAYREVQKEMKGRYPKHPWPDDPINHQATNKTKRQLNS